MQITVSTRHGNLSPSSQDKITAKMEKLSRFYERVTGIEVTVDLDHRETAHVEVRVSAERCDDFVARESHENVLAAVDLVVDKLEQQLRKHKEKLIDQHRGAGRRQQAS